MDSLKEDVQLLFLYLGYKEIKKLADARLARGIAETRVAEGIQISEAWNAYSTKQRYNYKCEGEPLEEIISHFGLKLMKK